MTISRRDLLLTSGVLLLGGPQAFGQGAAPPRAPGQTRGPEAGLLEALRKNRMPLTMTDAPAGPGWDWLLEQARAARFTLVGEEHGVAETAQLSAALFKALRPSGYNRMAIELSPVIAQDIEAAARRGGLRAILDFFAGPGTWSPMYLREEARFLADVVGATPRGERALWGFDRELFSDRYLIARLEPSVPRRAREPFARLKEASMTSWAQREKNPGPPFLFAAEPAVVSAVRAAWPSPDRESDLVLRTLEESLAINAVARTGTAWASSERRAQWMRGAVAARLREVRVRGSTPKVLLKAGYNHMIRGPNYVNIFDVGSMMDEVAALSGEGERAFHILVLPGPGSRQAVLGPGRSFASVSSDEFDEFRAGDQRLTRVLSNANATGHEVIDLRALRPLAMRGLEAWNSEVVRTIHGYDAAVIWKGARASA
jgi:hypothetical protein